MTVPSRDGGTATQHPPLVFLFLINFLFLNCFRFTKKSEDSMYTFCDYNKMSGIINLKRGKAYFGSWIQRFQSMINWPDHFGPLMR
jgi:hypothetical protein